MKKIVSLLVILVLFFGCKEETVKKPDHFIEKGVMMNIIYDLSLLEAIKYNTPSTVETYNVNPKEYIYKKYKIDSAQFSQNNIYYAANYAEYKDMFDQVTKRIDNKKLTVDSLIKAERKRDSLAKLKRKTDSLKLVKKKPLLKKDSLSLVKKNVLKKDSLLKLKKKINPKRKMPVRRRDTLRIN